MSRRYKQNDFITLYIPFWIYSNKIVAGGTALVKHFTFHSGYIPILAIVILLLFVNSLYIPFWIYSNLDGE